MEWLYTILYALLQAILGFLPISQTAACVFLKQLLRDDSFQVLGNAFFHLAFAVTIFVLCAADFKKLFFRLSSVLADDLYNTGLWFASVFQGKKSVVKYRRARGSQGRKLACTLFWSVFFACLFGMVFRGIGLRGYGTLLVNGLGLLVSAVFLLIAYLLPSSLKMFRRQIFVSALLYGFMAGVAVIPGFSFFALLLATTTVLGYEKTQAFRISCLLYAPLATLNFLYELLQALGEHSVQVGQCMLLTLVAILLSFVSVFVLPLRRHRARSMNLALFAFFSFAFGIVSLIIGVLRGVA